MMDAIKKIITSSTTGSLSTKRVSMLLATVALIASLLAVAAACARWINGSGDLGAGAVAALLGLASSVGLLAGISYRKAEHRGDETPAGRSAAACCVEEPSLPRPPKLSTDEMDRRRTRPTPAEQINQEFAEMGPCPGPPKRGTSQDEVQ